jgi:small-conductance mechanosensitive channel
MHVWAALLILVDWLVIAGYSKLRLRASLWVAVFPLSWLTFSVTRGILDGWWAYWFLNPNEPAGIPGMLQYVGGITVLMISLGFILIGARKLLSRLSRA